MYLFNTVTITLSTFGTLAAAAPASTAASPLVARANQALVNVYSGNSCDGSISQHSVIGSGAYSCFAVSNARSILVTENNCNTHTWSGNNCEGSNFHVEGNACHSVLYASVSVQC